MLTEVKIKNFKSIRDLKFAPRRVNVFIGEPNTGKTNILEALALLSEGVHQLGDWKQIFRCDNISELFRDQQISEPISVETSTASCKLSFDGALFDFAAQLAEPNANENKGIKYSVQLDGKHSARDSFSSVIKYYRFNPDVLMTAREVGHLSPPFGANLVSVLGTNKELRAQVRDLFLTRNFRLEMRPVENEIRLAKTVDDEFFTFPYKSISETWKRMVFYMAILETNKNSTLLLDEPETNTFPFYTANLAERVALDTSNQFFISTHNPYLLGSVVSKTPAADLAVYVTTMKNYDSEIVKVEDKNLGRVLDFGPDAFMNLDKLIAA